MARSVPEQVVASLQLHGHRGCPPTDANYVSLGSGGCWRLDVICGLQAAGFSVCGFIDTNTVVMPACGSRRSPNTSHRRGAVSVGWCAVVPRADGPAAGRAHADRRGARLRRTDGPLCDRLQGRLRPRLDSATPSTPWGAVTVAAEAPSAPPPRTSTCTALHPRRGVSVKRQPTWQASRGRCARSLRWASHLDGASLSSRCRWRSIPAV